MSALYQIDEIIRATGGVAQNIAAKSISSISIDSREIEKGALYVAIKGERFDGHDFVKNAINNGASAALVSKQFAKTLSDLPLIQDLPLIIVPDALKGLEDIARFARKRTKAKIIAVTGSAGKTSTKELLRNILEDFGKTHASIRSFNNHWGVPLMLARMAKDTEFGVFEIGMNHSGEITPLSKMVKPDITIITNIASAHLEQLGSLENIALAKAEIFAGLNRQGTAIINIDNEQRDILLQSAKQANISRIITYGFNENSDVQILNIEQSGDGMLAKVQFNETKQDIIINTTSFGAHKAANATATLIVVNELKLDINQSINAISSQVDTKGRGAKYLLGDKEKPLILIDDSFNANPLSMQMALESFALLSAPKGNKILVLGDMLELGEQSEKLHKDLLQYITQSNADKIFLVGQLMHCLVKSIAPKKAIEHANNINELEENILNCLDLGDVIMVKGSKGVMLAGLVKKIQQHFK